MSAAEPKVKTAKYHLIVALAILKQVQETLHNINMFERQKTQQRWLTKIQKEIFDATTKYEFPSVNDSVRRLSQSRKQPKKTSDSYKIAAGVF